MQLIPHLLLRSESSASRAAVLLRDAGYMVTKVTDDEKAVHLAASLHLDGVIVELPALAAVSAVRRLRDVLADAPPMLVITHSPDVIYRATGEAVLFAREMEEDLVSATDLMLAAHERQAV